MSDGEPEIERSAWSWGKNVRAVQEWLNRALEGAARRYGFEPGEAMRQRLFEPPMMVQDFGLQPQYPDDAASTRPDPAPMDWPWVKDAALALFTYDAKLPEDTKWEDLTKAQRRKAKDWAEFIAAPNRVSKKGPSIHTDIPLLLYLVFVIEEIIGRDFPMSRRKDDIPGQLGKRPPGGAAFMLLRAAYAQASAKLHIKPSKAETVYQLVRIARSEAFKKRVDELARRYEAAGMMPANSSRAEFVTAQPSECALLFAQAKRDA